MFKKRLIFIFHKINSEIILKSKFARIYCLREAVEITAKKHTNKNTSNLKNSKKIKKATLIVTPAIETTNLFERSEKIINYLEKRDLRKKRKFSKQTSNERQKMSHLNEKAPQLSLF